MKVNQESKFLTTNAKNFVNSDHKYPFFPFAQATTQF